MIRVVLPQHLRTLARVTGEVQLEVAEPVTQSAVLDALEARFPMLQGTIRDHVTQKRRAIPALLRLRRRSVTRFTGHAASRSGDFRERTVSHHWGNRGRIDSLHRFGECTGYGAMYPPNVSPLLKSSESSTCADFHAKA